VTGSVAELMARHFERLGRQSLEVPEITGPDGAPLVVWWRPVTNAEGAKIRRRAGASEAAMSLWTVILKAETEAGERMFAEDAETVRLLSEHVEGRLLARIASAILGGSDEAEMEK